MKQNLALLLTLALALVALHDGLAASADPNIPAGVIRLNHTVQPYTIALLDKITLKHADGTTDIVAVNQEGKLDLDGAATDGTTANSITAVGLSADALTAAVAKASKGTKVVHVEEFHTPRITVLGEVFHQIHIEMTEGPMRALDAIAAANGFTSIANTRRVKLIRQNAGVTDIYELDLKSVLRGLSAEQNILLQPGDVLTVPKNFL